MNQLLNWLPPDGWPRFAADAVWQSTLIGLIAVVSVHWIARRPATRACLSLAAIVVAVVLPIVSAVVRSADWGVLSQTVETVTTSHATAHQSTAAPAHARRGRVHVVAVSSLEALQDARQQSESSDHGAAMAVVVAWCLISGALLLRLLASALQIQKMLRSAKTSGNHAILNATHAAAERLGILPPRVLSSEAVQLPTVLAFGHGVILVPLRETTSDCTDRTESGSYSRWYAIMCHEMGHVRRRDGWNRLTVEIATALLPWQPLIWCLRRQFLLHAEEACDDWAVASGADPIEFAAVLTELIPTVLSLPLGASIMGTDARHRILRLLVLRTSPRPRTTHLQLVAITVATFTLVAGIALAQPGGEEKKEPIDRTATTQDAKLDNAGKRDQSKPTGQLPYVLEPPDIVLIQAVKLLPKSDLRIEKLDVLMIQVSGTPDDAPIDSLYVVDPKGEINLGAVYGRIQVVGLTAKEATQKVSEHLTHTLQSPSVVVKIADTLHRKHIAGEHSIAPDGYVNLGKFGQVHISGMTIDEARQAIEKQLSKRFEEASIIVKLLVQNSKVYYVIIQRGGAGDNIVRCPITGNETVLDALTQVNGLSRLSSMRIWISRPSAATSGEFKVLPVDWDSMVRGGEDSTNYQLLPGDRLFIEGAEVLPKQPAGN